MFNIDKKKFGAFVAALRKEKGITQKELSEQLSVCYAKEDKYNKSITKLQESASSANGLKEKLSSINDENKKLNERVEKLQKQQKQSNRDMKLLDEMIE